jgi:hypothetical protein
MSDLSDLLERFRRGAELLAMATTGAAGPVLDFKPEGAPLSVRQIVCHLADAEAVGAMRIRQIIAEDHPTLPAFDGDAWAAKLGYEKRKISQALETFRRLRADNHELLKDLPEAAFARTGAHSTDGPMTLRQVVEGFNTHTEGHVGEIQAIRAAYKEFRARQAVSPQ